MFCFVLFLIIPIGETVNALNEDEYIFETELVIVQRERVGLYDLSTYYGRVTCYVNNNLLWEFNSPEDGLSDSSVITDVHVNNSIAYFGTVNSLFALDINNGNMLWTVDNIYGPNCIVFDPSGNVYVSGYWGPDYVVVNSRGDVLDRVEYGGWIDEIRIEDNTLYVECRDSNENQNTVLYDISKYQDKEVSVLFNNEKIKFDQAPVIINGRTLVPIRAVVEAMKGVVEWEEATQTVTLSLNGSVIKLQIGSTTAYLNGEERILDVPPQIFNGRTLLPIRFIAEGFQFNVEWDEIRQTVIIYSEIINSQLLECIGKTKSEIEGIYGSITSSNYIDGGKYYVHGDLKTEVFYENKDNIYDYSIDDDVEDDAKCLWLLANLSELINNSKQKMYSIEELETLFGEYEFSNDLDNDFYPLCYYTFNYGDYIVRVESDHLNPQVEYVFVLKGN